jgi:hypothetical protein
MKACIGPVIVAAMAAFASTAFAREQAPPAKPDPVTTTSKSSADARSVAGKWTITIDTPIGPQTSILTIVPDGKKFTGTVSREDHQAPNKVAGEYDADKLTFTETYEGPDGPLEVVFEGTLQKDGSLAGTATLTGMEPVSWRASRLL